MFQRQWLAFRTNHIVELALVIAEGHAHFCFLRQCVAGHTICQLSVDVVHDWCQQNCQEHLVGTAAHGQGNPRKQPLQASL